METKCKCIVFQIALAFVLTSCGQQQAEPVPQPPSTSPASPIPQKPPTPQAPEDPQTPQAPSVPEVKDPVQEQLAGMTTEQKLGQMVLVGLKGATAQSDAEEMMNKYHVGGFILYKDNINNAKQTLGLLNQLKQMNRNHGVPLWLSLDQEGGLVSRMPREFTETPAAADISRYDDPNYTYAIHQAIGEEVASLGFNMDFAPVLDINSNPDNPVIGQRSFGTTVEKVIRHGSQAMKGISSKGVVPVIKHFPGHGDTSVDSHLELPVVNKSLEELEAFEIRPFADAIQHQADVVMVAHLLLPKVDSKAPASLSKKMITGLLREKLKFKGVVITDDMTMGGIVKHHEIGKAALQSVQAGSDIVLIGHDYTMQKRVLEALKQGMQSGVLTERMVDERVYRILKLKHKYGLADQKTEPVNVSEINRKISKVLDLHP
ncbi:hypothetical protein SY83_05150 [Paenibacillus swuensis]|uniref:Glycoside hydrolase family 3 N-terminal domain-containing protein n=1 Tax=Paenibacillus swuensis TaxID=1178515 RepID=A0A172TFS1_9BACL|nr:beta-N-acetylhexosaminidase [Paenibacillus swuensis]ANE45786.1 hypothetical protein SY83_05150 [Paenibacillus swuensis]